MREGDRQQVGVVPGSVTGGVHGGVGGVKGRAWGGIAI